MKSIVFLGFLAMFPIAAAAGCGDSTNDDAAGGTGGVGGGGGASSSSSSSSKASSSSSGTGGAGGGTVDDGDNDAASAKAFTLNMEASGSLTPPGSDVDYYKFEGTAGQQVLISVDAQPVGNPDPTYLDLVVTLYDANENQLAQNDDPRPRFSLDSQLFTVLPADGTYYVRAAECNKVFPGQCGNLNAITHTNYKLYVGGINPDIVVAETPGATTAVGAYTASMGSFTQKLFIGGFAADVETDVYSFTVPAVMPDPGNRPAFSFSFFPDGKDWSGASTSIQLATVKDSTGAVVAQINPDLSGLTPDEELDINAPLTPEASYTLEVSHATGAIGANPFYYVFNFPDLGSNPVEGPDNDTTPEALTAVERSNGSVSYFVEGDLEDGDVDQFSFAIPTDQNRISALCGARTSGSGLRDLTLSIRNSEGVEVTNGSGIETETESASVEGLPTPAGGTAVLHVSAASQDTVVTGRYYRCGVTVSAAQ